MSRNLFIDIALVGCRDHQYAAIKVILNVAAIQVTDLVR